MAVPMMEKLTEEEAVVLRMLGAEAPHLAEGYRRLIPKARLDTIQKLLTSFYREDILGCRSSQEEQTGPQANEKLQYLGEHVLLRIGPIYGYDRPGQIAAFAEQDGELQEIVSIEGLFALLPQNRAFRSLQLELENSSANLALAYSYWQYRKEQGKAESRTPIFFEQLCVTGHNLHPCAKTKLGMRPKELLLYAPEFQGIVPLRIAALHKKHAEQSSIGQDVLLQLHPELRQPFAAGLKQRGLSVSDYIPIPIHPWQWEHVLPSVYADELEQAILVLLPEIILPSYATSSFRTLETEKVAIKTAVHSQMTSTVRSISPQTANNAAPFTRMLREIMEREDEMLRRFQPLYEWEGGSFRYGDEQKRRNLSYVLRERTEVREGELAVVGTALYNESTESEIPLLLELLDTYRGTDGEERGYVWFSQYAELLLSGALTLMVKYGIGIEGHMQNIIPVFRDGEPVRMLFRDWGGARIYKKRLHRAGLQPQFYQDALIITDDVREMQNKVLYTVVQNHLGEIIYLLCRQGGLQEGKLWGLVRETCERVFAVLQEEHSEAVAEDEAVFFAAAADYKALLTMRLQGGKGYQYVRVANPLAEV